jgi:serine/threonine-protein kinase RsbW
MSENPIHIHPFEAELHIPATLETLENVYEWARHQLSRLPLAENKSYEILLALSEAVTNAIRHGNREDPATFVDIRFSAEQGRVTISVEDEGEGFDPERLPDPTHHERIFTPNGRGVFLLRSLANDVQFEFTSTGTVVIAHFLT